MDFNPRCWDCEFIALPPSIILRVGLRQVMSHFNTRFSSFGDNQSSLDEHVPEHRYQHHSLLPATEPLHPGTPCSLLYTDLQDRLLIPLEAEKSKGREGVRSAANSQCRNRLYEQDDGTAEHSEESYDSDLKATGSILLPSGSVRKTYQPRRCAA